METGGLSGYQEGGFYGAATYPILEVACFVTDLEMSEDIEKVNVFEVALYTSSEDIAKLHPWALDQHTRSGLALQGIRG
jgi:oligoribonuclease (3'-5' exoribonuclease)